MAIKVGLIVGLIILTLVFFVLMGVKAYQHYDDDDEHGIVAPILYGIFGGISLVLFILLPWNIHQINTGNIAVVRNMGKIVDTRLDGVYWDSWFTISYDYYDGHTQSISYEKEPFYTLDKQTVEADFLIQYQIDKTRVTELDANYKTISNMEDLMGAEILAAIKNNMAENNADQLISADRRTIESSIAAEIQTRLSDKAYPIDYNTISVSMSNTDFTDDYEAAVAAKVAQQQAYEKALIEQQQALAEAENAAAITKTKAEATAAVAKIQAEADKEVAMIQADAAAYAGKREASVYMRKLAGLNGWSVIETIDDDGNSIFTFKDSNSNIISAENVENGVANLIKQGYIDKWDGQLPVYYLGDDSSVLLDLGQ